MKKVKEIFNSMDEMITMTKRDGVLIVTVGALAGVIVGMLCSPKKNMKFFWGNHNGYSYQMEHSKNAEEEEVCF